MKKTIAACSTILSIIVSGLGGQSATSEPDAPFIKITVGELVTEPRDVNSAAWGDYDGDGHVDLFIAAFSGQDFLFRNQGDGTFIRQSKSTAGDIVGTAQNGLGLWADYDNDGHLDLFQSNAGGLERLFRNRGDGTFEKKSTPAFATDIANSFATAWGDFDGDGFVDLAVARGSIDGTTFAPSQVLIRNQGGTEFARLTNAVATGAVVSERGGGTACIWSDFDSDGDLDLFIGNNANGASGDHLFQNDHSGRFSRLTDGPVANDAGFAFCADWGDYDNDGNLDLFVGNGNGQRNYLYRNLGVLGFEKLEQDSVSTNRATTFTASCAWADYDNDGFLDLYVGNDGRNFLFHNQGDGAFERVLSGAPVTDSGTSIGVSWGDFDNDGFMDLFVANGGGGGAQRSQLYRNAGNTNRWLKLRLQGTSSNRSAIGARVRVRATLHGQSVWQMRQVSGGHESGQSDLRPNFGLADASVAELVRIEWPSGIVQELSDIPVNQILNVTEPALLSPVVVANSGEIELQVASWPGFVFDIQGSTDLKTWSPLGTVTNLNGTLRFRDPSTPVQFFRINPGKLNSP